MTNTNKDLNRFINATQFKQTPTKDNMKQCKICDDKPTEIFSQSGYTYICKPCMKKHGNSNHDKIGTYPNNYIPSDYYTLINNKGVK